VRCGSILPRGLQDALTVCLELCRGILQCASMLPHGLQDEGFLLPHGLQDELAVRLQLRSTPTRPHPDPTPRPKLSALRRLESQTVRALMFGLGVGSGGVESPDPTRPHPEAQIKCPEAPGNTDGQGTYVWPRGGVGVGSKALAVQNHEQGHIAMRVHPSARPSGRARGPP